MFKNCLALRYEWFSFRNLDIPSNFIQVNQLHFFSTETLHTRLYLYVYTISSLNAINYFTLARIIVSRKFNWNQVTSTILTFTEKMVIHSRHFLFFYRVVKTYTVKTVCDRNNRRTIWYYIIFDGTRCRFHYRQVSGSGSVLDRFRCTGPITGKLYYTLLPCGPLARTVSNRTACVWVDCGHRKGNTIHYNCSTYILSQKLKIQLRFILWYKSYLRRFIKTVYTVRING